MSSPFLIDFCLIRSSNSCNQWIIMGKISFPNSLIFCCVVLYSFLVIFVLLVLSSDTEFPITMPCQQRLFVHFPSAFFRFANTYGLSMETLGPTFPNRLGCTSGQHYILQRVHYHFANLLLLRALLSSARKMATRRLLFLTTLFLIQARKLPPLMPEGDRSSWCTMRDQLFRLQRFMRITSWNLEHKEIDSLNCNR